MSQSAPMLRLFAQLQRLERSRVTILIEGESGAGKELIAHALHERSRVASGPFIALNCGALDRTLARSELFGHRRGAFTGAIDSHCGAFEAASGGTLFLDEIGELPLDAQPMLLRALDTGVICRLGDPAERGVRVRVIAATNRNLRAEVQARRFREDLYFRLSVVTLRAPPLRERADDIDLLAQHFAAEEGLELGATTLRELRGRTWHGNVRELRNAIRAFAVLGSLPEAHPPLESASAPNEASFSEFLDSRTPYAQQKERLLRRFQKAYFDRVLAASNGNRSHAARLAGVERSYFSKVVAQRLPRLH